MFLHVEAESEYIVTHNTITLKLIGITLQVVPGDQDLAPQMTVLGIFHSMNLQASLDVVPGDEFLSTQRTDLWIVPSMNLHVYMYIVP